MHCKSREVRDFHRNVKLLLILFKFYDSSIYLTDVDYRIIDVGLHCIEPW